jgi:hypothetical protein
VKLTRPDLAALIVLGVIVVAIAACAVVRVEVPDILPQLGLLLAGIAGGAAIPTQTQTAAVVVPAQAPVAAAPVAFTAPAPAPVVRLDDTGIIPRVATHS